MKALFLLGRILFGGLFLASEYNHLTHHAGMARMVAAGGIPHPELAVIGSGLMILVGGTCVIFGVWPRAGACLIIIFLAVVTPLAHGFWAHTNPQQRADDLNNFTKNAALLGGAMMTLIITAPWPYSVERLIRRRSQPGPS